MLGPNNPKSTHNGFRFGCGHNKDRKMQYHVMCFIIFQDDVNTKVMSVGKLLPNDTVNKPKNERRDLLSFDP